MEIEQGTRGAPLWPARGRGVGRRRPRPV